MEKDQTVLRDRLAIGRTILANERTFLAYVRTSLAFLITGVGFVKFIDVSAVQLAGWIFIAVSVILALFGLHRYRTTRREYRELLKQEKSKQ